MEELSLLVWLSRGNKKKLVELMCKYTGCEPEDYPDVEIIRLFEQTLINISRKYYLKSLLYEYFSARHRWKDYAFLYPKIYTETDAEIDALGAAIFSVQPKIFDEEDSNKIKELKKEYLEEVKKDEKSNNR